MYVFKHRKTCTFLNRTCEKCKEKRIWNRFSAEQCDLKDLNSFFVCGYCGLKRETRLFFRTLLISTLAFSGRTCQKARMTNDPVRSRRWNKSDEPTESSWTFGPKVVVGLNIKRLNGICKIWPCDNRHHRQRYVLRYRVTRNRVRGIR